MKSAPTSGPELRRSWGGVALCGLFLLLLWACGDTNLFSPGASQPPRVEIRQPRPGVGLSADDSVLVEVDVSSALESRTGIASLRFGGDALVGDPELGTGRTIEIFQPKQVTFDPPVTEPITVRRFLVPALDTTLTEPGFIRVTVTDEAGNEVSDSVAVLLGAPGVRFVSPADGDRVGPGDPLPIEVEAVDPDGVVSIRVFREDGLEIEGLPIEASFQPALDTTGLSETVTVPNTTGTIELFATAVNRDGLEGRVGPIQLTVASGAQSDEQPPQLRVDFRPRGSTTDPRRVEPTDELLVRVEGRDNPGGFGVARVGATVLAHPRSRGTPVRTVPIADRTFAPARTGTFTTNLSVPASVLEELGAPGDPTLDLTQAPDTVEMEVFAYMVDSQGNCAAATSSEDFESLECQVVDGNTISVGGNGQTDFVVGVSGQTVGLPAGGRIADAVVDQARDFLVLSNIERGRLEVFDMTTSSFLPGILVGAEPWGMTFSRSDPDSLFVGNSFGTNISVVDMASRREDVERRIQTPNSVLFDAAENRSESGYEVTVTIHGFSDRPQFIAQDSRGALVYSTLPTDAANLGTIRLATLPSPGRPHTEVILYTDHGERNPSDQNVAIDRLDDFDLDGFQVVDHVPGDTTDVLTEFLNSDDESPADAAVARLNARGTDARGFLGSAWDVEAVGLSDTTFVAASGDGTKVAIGEGATGPTGRVMMYDAATQEVSGIIPVTDLVENAAERVLGVDMNHDGTMGVARGELAVYFFTPNLRLQGGVDVTPGGAGVALHPFHTDGPTSTDPNVALAFAGTGDRTIEIFDTRHFSRIGVVSIRETIVGQIRSIMPEDSDQPDGILSCTSGANEVDIPGLGTAKRIFADGNGFTINDGLDDSCVVVKLAGVTADGGVVVVNVTKADIIREHPDN